MLFYETLLYQENVFNFLQHKCKSVCDDASDARLCDVTPPKWRHDLKVLRDGSPFIDFLNRLMIASVNLGIGFSVIF